MVERLATELCALGSATLGESGGRPMHPRLKPVWPGPCLAGPALTARCGPGDNLAIHAAVAGATSEGAVLVVDASEVPQLGYWGEVLTTGAQARGIAGLVIDGGVRDVAAVAGHGFPVFAALVALPGATKLAGGSVGRPVVVGGVEVAQGDWIVGDLDGVVGIHAGDIEEVVAAGRARAAREQAMFTALREGATTVEMLGLDESKLDDVG